VTRELVQTRIAETFGMLPRSGWPSALDEGLGELTRRLAVDEAEIFRRLANNAELLRDLAAYLTIDESHFLRHSEQLATLVEALAQNIEAGRRAVVWSLGCSRGEEPYSVAILLRERLGAAAARASIAATDINERALAVARRGLYRDWSLRGVPVELGERYFTREPNGVFRLDATVMAAVAFEIAALPQCLAPRAAQSVDAVLFRNVGIYLDASALETVYAGIARTLAPHGLLLIAPADPAPPRELFARLPGEWSGIFVRRAEAGSAVVDPAGGFASLAVAPDRVGVSPVPALASSSSSPPPKPSLPPPTGSRVEPVAVPSLAPAEHHEVAPRRAVVPPAGPDEPSLAPADEQVRRLRCALYLNPQDALARFRYATALQRVGQLAQAKSQVLCLTEELECLAADVVLADGKTRVARLLNAVLLMRASLP